MLVAAKLVQANGVLALVESVRVNDRAEILEQPPEPELASAVLDLQGIPFGD